MCDKKIEELFVPPCDGTSSRSPKRNTQKSTVMTAHKDTSSFLALETPLSAPVELPEQPDSPKTILVSHPSQVPDYRDQRVHLKLGEVPDENGNFYVNRPRSKQVICRQ